MASSDHFSRLVLYGLDQWYVGLISDKRVRSMMRGFGHTLIVESMTGQ